MRIFFDTKPVLAIAIATAIEEMVAKDACIFSAEEADELERIAKSIERQSQETASKEREAAEREARLIAEKEAARIKSTLTRYLSMQKMT